jgi:hypothetical protein
MVLDNDLFGTESRDLQIYPRNRRSLVFALFCSLFRGEGFPVHTSTTNSLSFSFCYGVDTQGLAASVMDIWIGRTLERCNEEGGKRRRAQDEPEAGATSRVGRLSLMHWLYISIAPPFRNCSKQLYPHIL